jgi:hypothetical protein
MGVTVGDRHAWLLGQVRARFTPEQANILTDAFDDAWGRLQASRAPYGQPEYAPAARVHLARYIISSAGRGNLDRQKLADDALVYVSRQKLSRTPPQLTLL